MKKQWLILICTTCVIIITGCHFNLEEQDAEWIRESDSVTGYPVWQITSCDSPSVACYFEAQVFIDGKWFISDGQDPGYNPLIIIDLIGGKAEFLCWPNASITGGHEACAHVHPSFSSSGNYVTFTSDKTGTPQVYVIPVKKIMSKMSKKRAGG
jgi:hypothetical protein